MEILVDRLNVVMVKYINGFLNCNALQKHNFDIIF